MKKISIVIIAIFMFLSVINLGGMVQAAGAIKVVIDSSQKTFTQPPVIQNGHTLVPMRGIFESLGAGVTWNSKTKSIIAAKGSIKIEITINKTNATVNGKSITLDQKAVIVNGSTMVPLRFVSEALGAAVRWDGTTKTIYITSPKTVQKKVLTTADIMKQNSNRVVYIETDTKSGDGVILKDGLILTNYHVVSDASLVTITTNDGNIYDVEGVVAYDKNTDLAIIKTKQNLLYKQVTIDSPKNLKVNDKVLAISNPDGFSVKSLEGTIQSFSSNNGVNDVYISSTNLMQTNGQALFNMYGELIGISTTVNGNSNVAISIDHISNWVKNILSLKFDSILATFAKKVYESTLPNSIAELQAGLNNQQLREILTANGVFSIDSYTVTEAKDGTINIDGKISDQTYASYKNAYVNVEADVQAWVDEMAYVLYNLYPDKHTSLTITTWTISNTDPSAIAAPEDIVYDDVHQYWIIKHKIISIDIPVNASTYDWYTGE